MVASPWVHAVSLNKSRPSADLWLRFIGEGV
jgi:hypothetical protein